MFRQYYKSALIYTGIFSLTFIVACGGGKSKTPPPIPPQVVDKAPFDDLYAQANRAEQSCSSGYSPMFTQLAMAYIQQNQNQGVPAAATAQSLLPLLQQQSAAKTGGQQQCQNDLMNFIMAFTTITLPSKCPQQAVPLQGNAKKQVDQLQAQISLMQQPQCAPQMYANTPEGRQWFASRLGGIMNNVWGNVQGGLQAQGVQLPMSMLAGLQQQMMGGAMYVAQNQIIPGLGQFSGMASQALGQYGGGSYGY